jgi:hypothetical protein
MLLDVLGYARLFEGFFQNHQAPGELATHDRVGAVRLAERPARVFDAGAQVLGCVLVFLLLDALTARIAKEKPDHDIVEDAIDETVDDAPQRGLTAEVFEQAASHCADSVAPAAHRREPKLCGFA